MIKPNSIPSNANMLLIGGGNYPSSARPLLEMGLDLTGKNNPRVLLVPTPKNKSKDFDTFTIKAPKVFGEGMGASVDVLHGFEKMPSESELEEKFGAADMIYVSGGNTRYAIEQWKKHGVDKMLDAAMRQGKIITGISAGALTWFKEGHSDSSSYEVEEGDPWDFDVVDGLGHIDTIVTPHANSIDTPDGRLRSEHFREILEKLSRESGLTIDNNAGILCTSGLVRVVTSNPESGIHVVSADPDGQYSDSSLEAPTFNVTSDNTSADQIPDDGISWDDFYKQLSKKS